MFIPLVASLRVSRSWGGDLGAPVAVALDGDRLWPEHLGPTVASSPAGEVATDQGVLVQFRVSFPEPAEDPPEGEVVDITGYCTGLMAVVFDLAEALNIGWGIVGGEVTGSIRDRVGDVAFRRAVIKAIPQRRIAQLGVDQRALKRMIRHEEFVIWAVNPDATEVSDSFDSVAGAVLGGLDDEAVQVLAQELFGAFTRTALKTSPHLTKAVYATLARVDETQLWTLIAVLELHKLGEQLLASGDRTSRAIDELRSTHERLGRPAQAWSDKVPSRRRRSSRADHGSDIVREIASSLELAGRADLIPEAWTVDAVIELAADPSLAPLPPESDELVELRTNLSLLVTALEAEGFAVEALRPAQLSPRILRQARNALLSPVERPRDAVRQLDYFVEVLRRRPVGVTMEQRAVRLLARLLEHAGAADRHKDALLDWAVDRDVDPAWVHRALEASAAPADVRLLVDFWVQRQPPDQVPSRIRGTIFVDGVARQRRDCRLRDSTQIAALEALGEATAWAKRMVPGCDHVDVLVPDALLGLPAERARVPVGDWRRSYRLGRTTDVLLRYAVRLGSPDELARAREKVRRIHRNGMSIEWLDLDALHEEDLYDRLVDPAHDRALAMRCCPFPDHVDGLVSAVMSTPYVVWPEGSWDGSDLETALRSAWSRFPEHLVQTWRELARSQQPDGGDSSVGTLRGIWDDEEWLMVAASVHHAYVSMEESREQSQG